MKTAIILIFTSMLTGCYPNDLGPGQYDHIAFSNNYAIRTDSSIVIFDRDSGKVLCIIKMNQ